MLKQMVNLEMMENDSLYVLSMPVASSYGAAINACFKILEELHKMQAQAIEAMRPKESPSDSSEA